MGTVFVVIERYEDEVSTTLYRDEERALGHLRDRRSDYVEGLSENARFITDAPSRVYDSDGGWEIWYEKATIL